MASRSGSFLIVEKEKINLKLEEINNLKKNVIDSIEHIVEETQKITNGLVLEEDKTRFLMNHPSVTEKLSKCWCLLINVNDILSSSDLSYTESDLESRRSTVEINQSDTGMIKDLEKVDNKSIFHNERKISIEKLNIDANVQSRLNPEVPDWKPNNYPSNTEVKLCTEDNNPRTIISNVPFQKVSCSVLPPSKLLQSKRDIINSNIPQNNPTMHPPPTPYNYSGGWYIRPQIVPSPPPWQPLMQPPLSQSYPVISTSKIPMIPPPPPPIFTQGNTSSLNKPVMLSQPVICPSSFPVPSTTFWSSPSLNSFSGAPLLKPESFPTINNSLKHKVPQTESLQQDINLIATTEGRILSTATDNTINEAFCHLKSPGLNISDISLPKNNEVIFQSYPTSNELSSQQNTIISSSNTPKTISDSVTCSDPFLSSTSTIWPSPIHSDTLQLKQSSTPNISLDCSKPETESTNPDINQTSPIETVTIECVLSSGLENSCLLQNNEMTVTSEKKSPEQKSEQGNDINESEEKKIAITENEFQLKHIDKCSSNTPVLLSDSRKTCNVSVLTQVVDEKEVSVDLIADSSRSLLIKKDISNCNTATVKLENNETHSFLESPQGHLSSDLYSSEIDKENVSCIKVDEINLAFLDKDLKEIFHSVSPDESISSISLNSEAGSYLEQLSDVIQSMEILEGDVFEGIVVQLQDPSSFWFQALNTKFESLLSELSSFYGTSKSKRRNIEPVVGLFCCAYFDQDEFWHRVQIKDIHYKDSASTKISQVTVFDIDYGNIEKVPVQNVKKLEKKFAELPAQAIRCSLDRIVPADGSHEWSTASIGYFNQLVFGETVSVTILESLVSSSYIVRLQVPFEDGQCIDIADYLIEKGLAIHGLPENSNQNLSEKEINFVKDTVCAAATILKPDTNLVERKFAENQCKYSIDEFTWNAVLNSLIPDSKISFITSHVETPTSFFIHILKLNISNWFSILEEELQNLYDISKPYPLFPEELCSGMFCIALYPEDKQWYRAQILKVDDRNQRKTKDVYEVLYVDFGNTFWVSQDELRPLKKTHGQIPKLAVHCCLADIMPAEIDAFPLTPNCYEWPVEAVSNFKQLTTNKQIFEAHIIEKTELKEGEDLFHLRMWNTTNDESRTISEQLLKDGFAKPIDRNHEWNPMESDYLSDRNLYSLNTNDPEIAVVGYKAQDESRICKFFRVGKPCWKEMCPFLHINTGISDVTTDVVLVNCQMPTVELPLPGTLVAVQISSFVDPNNFHVVLPYGTKGLHLDSIDEEHEEDDNFHFENFSKELNSIYRRISNFHHPNPNISFSIGEVVVACSDDDDWYRARISDVNEEENQVQVFYVDFGSTEWISERRIMPIETDFLNFPTQAVQCCLGNIEAVGDNGWSSEAVDLFESMCTENKILVAQVLEIYNSTLIVDLYDTTSESDIHLNEYFVKRKVAKLVPAVQWCYWERQKLSVTPQVMPG